MQFSRQEYLSGLPFATPGDLPNLDQTHISSISFIDKKILNQWATQEAQKDKYMRT